MVARFTEGRPSSPGGISGVFVYKAAPTTVYHVMGPLPAGRVLARLWWRMQSLSGTMIEHRFGFALSASPAATAENFRHGESLLVGRGVSLEGQAMTEALLNTRQWYAMEMWPGVELRSGSTWLVIARQVSVATDNMIMVSLQFVWPGWYGGQFASLPVPPAEPEG